MNAKYVVSWVFKDIRKVTEAIMNIADLRNARFSLFHKHLMLDIRFLFNYDASKPFKLKRLLKMYGSPYFKITRRFIIMDVTFYFKIVTVVNLLLH